MKVACTLKRITRNETCLDDRNTYIGSVCCHRGFAEYRERSDENSLFFLYHAQSGTALFYGLDRIYHRRAVFFNCWPKKIGSAVAKVSGVIDNPISILTCSASKQLGGIIIGVGIFQVLKHHPLGVEKRAVESNGRSHDFGILLRPLIEHGQDQGLKFTVQRRDLSGRITFSFPVVADGPVRAC